jgi:hypothetical protein
MPFVIEQESIRPDVSNDTDANVDPTTSMIVVTLFLIYLFRNFILSSFKFGLFVIIGFMVYNFIR